MLQGKTNMALVADRAVVDLAAINMQPGSFMFDSARACFNCVKVLVKTVVKLII